MTSRDRTKSHLTGWLFFIALTLVACSGEVAPVKLAGATMGTSYHVTYLPPASAPQASQVQAQLDTILVAVNDSMSTYQENSEINQARDTSRAYQVSILQHIDAAAFELYATYVHYELDRSGTNGVDQNFKDLDVVMIGGILKF